MEYPVTRELTLPKRILQCIFYYAHTWSESTSNRNLLSNIESVIFAMMFVNLGPRQPRGPSPNGKYDPGTIFDTFSAENLNKNYVHCFETGNRIWETRVFSTVRDRIVQDAASTSHRNASHACTREFDRLSQILRRLHHNQLSNHAPICKNVVFLKNRGMGGAIVVGPNPPQE